MAREKIEDFGEKIGGARKDLFEKKGSLTAADTREWTDIEKEKYIYSIAYGKLHCFGTEVQTADV